jgi:predicted RNA-binding protein with PIN domain
MNPKHRHRRGGQRWVLVRASPGPLSEAISRTTFRHAAHASRQSPHVEIILTEHCASRHAARHAAVPAVMPPLYLVDGFNFLHAIVLRGRDRAGWWSRENQAKVVAAVAEVRVMGRPLDVCIVFDRRRAAGEPEAAGHEPVPHGTVQIHHAPDADDYIVRRCGELAGQREVVVVTADRSLRDRARNHGARGLSPWLFASAAVGVEPPK